jgi:serine/threonine-protein kinase
LTERPEALQLELADRYAFERELGRGGMATVYLARDLKHDREVAIKVLRPESAALIGTERFLLEIGVAGSLDHPNILPLYDSGQAADLLFYVMPFVQGGSLADRIEREVQLPIEDALAITREVSDALMFAHDRGFVHRDIKPENILLWRGRAVVADFGIARVMDSADAVRLTATGMAVGTPAYMSPEQASGSHVLDGRADVYALGCVLFEMLIGQAPYTGPTVQVVLARHALESIPSILAVRDTVSPTVGRAVTKAMAKLPADRFATPAEFADALHAPASGMEPPALPAPAPSRPWSRAAQVAVASVLVVAATLISFWLLGWGGGEPPALDEDLVALMPFRVSGSTDTEFDELARGIHELLYVRITGALGLRAVYPGTGASVWSQLAGEDGTISEEAGLRGTAELGAGKLLRGQVFGSGSQLVLTATLLAVPQGTELATVDDVRGPRDSVVSLVDRLAARLLSQGAGVTGQRLEDLVTADLDALKAYLAGRDAFNRADYSESVRWFSQALDIDSTFALAGIGLATSYTFIGSGGPLDRGLRLAWAARERLSPADRLFLSAFAGPRYPERATHTEDIAAWEAVVEAIPDRQEIHFQYGDMLIHWGPLVGLARPLDRAAAAFRRALELDSLAAPAIGHLLELAARVGDTATTNLYGALYLSGDEVKDFSEYYRWRVAIVADDTVVLDSLRGSFDDFDVGTLDRILVTAQADGVGMVDAEPAAEALRRKAVGRDDLRDAYDNLRFLALNRGQPERAAGLFRSGREIYPRPSDGLAAVIEALYWGGDQEAAEDLVAITADALRPQTERDLTGPFYHDLCAAHLWRLARQDVTGIDAAIGLLRDAEPATLEYDTGYVGLCAAILDAQLSEIRAGPDTVSSLAHLDSLLRGGALADQWTIAAANLVAARLHEVRGDMRAALAAVARRPYGCCGAVMLLSTYLREEARLATLAGDQARAVQAYDHYLSLRVDPEPSQLGELERTRAALRELVGENR